MDHKCQVKPLHRAISDDESTTKQAAIFAVWGLGCPNCAVRVRNGLITTKGVLDAYVDHLAGMAWVLFNPELVDTNSLIRAVAEAGNDGRHEYVAQLLA